MVELASTGLFRGKWTRQIHEEWIVNLLENRSDLNREALERTRDLVDQTVPDCLVAGYEDLVEGIELPDANDRHVLAAAIHCGADAIVTFNLKDFPPIHLEKYDMEAIHPDEFIYHQFGIDASKVIISAQRCRGRLRNPAKTATDYLAILEKQGLPKTVAELMPYESVI